MKQYGIFKNIGRLLPIFLAMAVLAMNFTFFVHRAKPAAAENIPFEPHSTRQIECFSEDGLIEMRDVPTDAFAPASLSVTPAPDFDMVRISGEGTDENKIVITIMGDGFTAGQQDDFIAAAQSSANYLLNKAPFDSFRDHINVYVIKVVSNVTGVASDRNNLIDNYFGSCFYFDGQTSQLIYITKTALAKELVNKYTPNTNVTLILGNSVTYGGGGGEFAVVSLHSAANEIVVHELGHAFGGLVDEYWWRGEEAPNMTAAANKGNVKWQAFVGVEGVGEYAYTENSASLNWLRPHQNCVMRYLNREFCEVCKAQLVKLMAELTGEPFFGKNTFLSSALPEGTERIVDYAYYGCGQLAELTIASTVTDIGRYAFLRCGSLESIVNHAETPQDISSAVTGSDIFTGVIREDVTLRVPEGKTAEYIAAGWGGFDIIESLAQIPVITAQPAAQTVDMGGSVTLSVTAEVSDGGELSYQWYCNLTDSTKGGILIEGETLAEYNAPTDTVGTVYYYVFVTNTNNEVDGVKTAAKVSDTAAVVVNPIIDAETPIIGFQPVGGSALVGEESVVLSVAAGVNDGGMLSYQWYYSMTDSAEGGEEIKGETLATYDVPTDNAGTRYYYVVVTNMNNEVNGAKTAKAVSDTAEVVVVPIVDAEKPAIVVQPVGGEVFVGGSVTLSVTAGCSDCGILSYQWYYNLTDSNENGVLIEGATSATFNAPSEEAGTAYYYVVVTNVNNAVNGVKTATMTSQAVRVTCKERGCGSCGTVFMIDFVWFIPLLAVGILLAGSRWGRGYNRGFRRERGVHLTNN
ncbi:MAG: M64 family metallo-endopeptidase [Firmicutes bacterium]|nr:M64 family metallo-endopeptidase [Bacillota bacterium]